MENKENEKDIEIDLGKVQYSMVLKHKYSFQELNKIMIDLSEKGYFKSPPEFLKAVEICSESKKVELCINELIDFESKKKEKDELKTKIDVPKSNPLNNFSRKMPFFESKL